MIFGDGKTRDGTGAPPHFAGHTFADAGNYDVLLVVNQSNNRRYMALATSSPGRDGGGGGGGGGGDDDHDDAAAAPPPADRDEDRHGARERPAVHRRHDPVQRDRRRDQGHASRSRPASASSRSTAQDGITGQVQARPRHRQGQADRRAPARGRRLQRLPEAQDEQRRRARRRRARRSSAQLWGDGKGRSGRRAATPRRPCAARTG